MKIALINEPWNGGASRCVSDLTGLLGSKHEMRVFPEGKDPAARDLRPWLRQFAPDVVHLHSFYGWLPYRLLGDLAREYPVAFTPHDPRPIGDIDPVCYRCARNRTCVNCPLVSRARRIMPWRNPYFLRRIKRIWVHLRAPQNLQVVGVSHWLIDRMRQREMRRFQFSHIPNGVDVHHFHRRQNAREQLGLAADAEVILFLAGRGMRWQMNPNKGLPDLAEAFVERIAPRRPRAILAVGGEWLAPNHPQVRGLGFVERDQLPLWYSAASVYVLPTRGDNFPYTVMEAMACECPVVASDIGGLREQVDPGVTGFLPPPNDPVALADAIESALSQPDSGRAMGRAARARVEKMFSLEQFVARHEELYQSLCR